MDQGQKLQALDTYFNLMTVNGSAYVFNIAQKMNFFKPFLDQDKLTSEQVSSILGFHSRPVELILNTLTSMDVLIKKDETYTLAPVTKLLVGNYENLSSDYWEHLPEYLMKGTPYKKMDSVVDSESEYQTQVKSLEWMMMPSAMYLAQMLQAQGTSDKLNILDVGAGAGVWSYSFLKLNDQARATLADWPAVLKVAKASACEQKVEKQVSYIEGNYHETNFGKEEFDIAILGNVTHIETEQGNNDLFVKIKKSLKPGGKLIILDCFGENTKGDTTKWLYQLGLAIRTEQGQVYPPEQLQSWLTEHGFCEFNFHSIDITPYTMGALIAVKK